MADGSGLSPRPKTGTGANAVKVGFGTHGFAVPDAILAYGGRRHLTGWQVEVEVNQAVDETGFRGNTDAVPTLPTKTGEVDHRPATAAPAVLPVPLLVGLFQDRVCDAASPQVVAEAARAVCLVHDHVVGAAAGPVREREFCPAALGRGGCRGAGPV